MKNDAEFTLKDMSDRELNILRSIAINDYVKRAEGHIARIWFRTFIDYLYAEGFVIIKKEEIDGSE